MKKKFLLLLLLGLFLYLIIFPQHAVPAAASGLLLWYQIILPTLLPFAILTGICLSSNLFYLFARPLHRVLAHVLPVSIEGTFPLAAGFLFGFPMGSKICASMLEEGKISYEEASVLFIISNNMSPVFVSSFILNQSLKLPALVPVTFLILYLPPLLLGRFLLKRRKKNADFLHKNTTSRFQFNFKIIDAAIINGFETLVRLGGYIMLFSIAVSVLSLLPDIPELVRILFTGGIEITNGIWAVAESSCPLLTRYLLCIAFTAFGGCSGIAQTTAMIQGTGLSIRPYILTKFLLCMESSLLACLICRMPAISVYF